MLEKFLCLQLLGYTHREIYSLVEQQIDKIDEIVAQSENVYEKAKMLLSKQKECGIHTIHYYAEDYPKHFAQNLGYDAPVLIHLLGDKSLIYREDCITIIGARRADAEGLKAAYHLAHKFASEGHIIVSGLALGCDTNAHRGCLDAGGKTIAIVASGLNITHPKENKSLQEEIIQKGGLILSEQPFGVKANPRRLVARCRMQVVLSQPVIMAQCPILSGTMYAVYFAQEYDGDIWGWENHIYAVEYESYNEKNSGNQFLLEHELAMSINWKNPSFPCCYWAEY